MSNADGREAVQDGSGQAIAPPATYSSHVRRKVRVKPTQCPAGHPYSPENTLIKKDGVQSCRTCRRQRATRRQQEALSVQEDWVVDLIFAIVEQARLDYRSGTERESAAVYLQAAGLLTADGRLRLRRRDE